MTRKTGRYACLTGILFSDGLRSCVAVAVEGDQTVGGAVVCRRAAFEFGFDGFGQLFTVFHAPLVEGVDTPNHALNESTMFVSSHQHAEVERRQAVDEQAVARTVAGDSFCGARRSRSSWGRAANSICTSSKVLPFISASAWAKALATVKRCWRWLP